jgi:hypothetical protein
MRKIERFCKERIISIKPLATRISRTNAYQRLPLGHIEEQSVQKYTQHNQTTDRRYTPSRQRRHFGNSIPEFGETHSNVLGCEKRPFSAGPVLHRSRHVCINFQVIISIT